MMKQQRSYDQLPAHYVLDYDLDLLKNKKAFIWLNIWSVLLLIPFLVFLGPVFTYAFPNGDAFELLYTPFLFLLATIAIIVVHEGIHALFFKRATKHKVKFQFHGWAFSASVPNVYFRKFDYLLVGLSPFVILTLVFALLEIILPTPMFFFIYLLLTLHTSSCIGDFYVIYKLCKYPPETLIEDTGVGMRFFIPTPQQD